MWFSILLNVTTETFRFFVWLALLSLAQNYLDLQQLGSRYIYFWWLLMSRPAERAKGVCSSQTIFLEGQFFSLKLCIIPGTPGFLIIAPTNDYLQTKLGACNLFDSADV